MPLIKFSAYWILRSMFLVIYYTANMQCYNSRKIAYTPFKKLTHLPLFKIKGFLTCHSRYFSKNFLLSFERWDANFMTLLDQLAPQQIINLQNTTVWQQNSAKTFIKRPISTTSEIWISGNKKVLKKISNWDETDASGQSPF